MSALASQGGLFDPAGATLEPAGLAYQDEFLAQGEERSLIALIGTLSLRNAEYKQYTARRRVASFGHSYDYDANILRDAPSIPESFAGVLGKVAAWCGVGAEDFVQLLVAEYLPGTPLGWHRDVPDYEVVAGVSLGTSATLRFRPYPHHTGAKPVLRELQVEPRSIYSMRGPARWEWQHCVPPTPGLRWSLTFRTRSARR